jgi:hypothetical protein
MGNIKLPPHLQKLVNDPEFVRKFNKMQVKSVPKTKIIKKKGYTIEEFTPY